MPRVLAFVISWAFVAGDTLRVALSKTTLTPPLKQDFASFSIEVPTAPLYLGLNGAPRTSFVNLMNVLRNATGGEKGPNIRIGGGTVDMSA